MHAHTTYSAAIKLAKLARERGIPVMLDAEKDRPHLRTLVPLCDYLCTNTAFPRDFTGSATTEEGMAALLTQEGGHAKMITTTLGSKGSMVMARKEDLSAMATTAPVVKGLPLSTTVQGYTCGKTGGTFFNFKLNYMTSARASFPHKLTISLYTYFSFLESGKHILPPSSHLCSLLSLKCLYTNSGDGDYSMPRLARRRHHRYDGGGGRLHFRDDLWPAAPSFRPAHAQHRQLCGFPKAHGTWGTSGSAAKAERTVRVASGAVDGVDEGNLYRLARHVM